jgi:ABC-type nitrate/sulfonate/bicarbonate transport system ATPase subunit
VSTLLRFINVKKEFNGLKVLNNITFNVSKGEIACLLGPSGAGKTTILRIAGGLERPDEGIVERNYKKHAYVFQDHRLIPWLTVRKNLEIVVTRITPDVKQRIEQVLNIMGLKEFSEYYPNELSGGMRQRVAIARALIVEPDMLYLDEPFSSLDYPLRIKLLTFLRKLIKSKKITALYVTHDLREAISICDVIYILTKRPARIKEKIILDLPEDRFNADAKLKELYERRLLKALLAEYE